MLCSPKERSINKKKTRTDKIDSAVPFSPISEYWPRIKSSLGRRTSSVKMQEQCFGDGGGGDKRGVIPGESFLNTGTAGTRAKQRFRPVRLVLISQCGQYIILM